MAGIIMGLFDLIFCVSCLATGKYALGLDIAALRSFTVVTLVFSGQAVFYVARERRHLWSSRPGPWLVASSIVDLTLIGILATKGILMASLPFAVLAGLFIAAIIFAMSLDVVKLFLFRRFQIA
jgi:H+-transporting ATPase